MMPHLIFTLLLAVLLAAAMAAMGDRPARERLYVAARVFFGCVASIVAGGWVMRLIHG